jgi:hypothetical protein
VVDCLATKRFRLAGNEDVAGRTNRQNIRQMSVFIYLSREIMVASILATTVSLPFLKAITSLGTDRDGWF